MWDRYPIGYRVESFYNDGKCSNKSAPSDNLITTGFVVDKSKIFQEIFQQQKC